MCIPGVLSERCTSPLLILTFLDCSEFTKKKKCYENGSSSRNRNRTQRRHPIPSYTSLLTPLVTRSGFSQSMAANLTIQSNALSTLFRWGFALVYMSTKLFHTSGVTQIAEILSLYKGQFLCPSPQTSSPLCNTCGGQIGRE